MPLDKEKIKKIVEGALFSAGQPMNLERLAGLFFDEERPTKDDFKEALSALQEDYAGRGVELKEVASGYRFQASEGVGEWVSRLWEEKPARYSRALLETLALVAYRQPITRGEIEEIRGVSVSSHIMKTLLEREWVRVVGHRDVPGRPAMFATTRIFLDYFDLKSLVELPPLSEIRDFDKINEELELEDVVPGDSGVGDESCDADSGNEVIDEGALEEGLSESATDSAIVMSSAEEIEASVEDSIAEVTRGETHDKVDNVIIEAVQVESVETSEEPGSAPESEAETESSTQSQGLADVLRKFEAQKELEQEVDESDAAVASEAQIEEDLMIDEAVERHIEQDGTPVGDVED
ncbi:SMC-Scp complex subunit ScpB [Gammaproteobacteria bacterium 45_16_T64]|nr:SMC-Scp complex subunit ScpB [Gammaproteobacteria bacterium 45_16_T64]